ncbi:exodeoxyribonuclease V subunit alpha [Malikia sp.]|uniref:exodeoxyribonuclease V subunit alpha n=1 Tax=Malikia sp. TaxID=2070706 RepID=UPI002628D712|nr:exodeoxyribonuclease V subunit alpha [Malikia sp.]MDD2727983.1 exodeoxyribonuclease V subunit alpha [Malikia sp.]
MNASMSATITPIDPDELLATLRAWSDRGWLRRLDSAMAAFVRELDAQAAAPVLLASALLTQMEGRGHTALALAPCVSQPQGLLGWSGEAQAALDLLWARLPRNASDWVQALRASPLVRVVPAAGSASSMGTDTDAGDEDRGQPLVLAGTMDAPMLYLRRYWIYEEQVATQIARRAARTQAVDLPMARAWLDRLFDGPAPIEGCDWQKVACGLALRGGLSVITGGPGTGKTYTAARLLALLLATHPEPASLRVALAAPTGKAAARLRSSIDQSLQEIQQRFGDKLDLRALTQRIGQAKTVHALLGARPDTRQFRFDADTPLDVDVLIVDETSMVHLEMMAALLQALPQQARLILLGDKDQLASVEAGSVLGDLCARASEARYSPQTLAYLEAVSGQRLTVATASGSPLEQQTVMLRHSRRFGTDIGLLARAVNKGVASADRADPPGAYELLAKGSAEAQDPALTSPIGQPSTSPGKVWLATGNDAAIVVRLALRGRPLAPDSFADYLGIINQHQPPPGTDHEAAHADWVKAVLRSFERFRILCAVHDGTWGDRQLNQDIQQALARAGLLKPSGEWFIGRPVMVTRNDAALGVFNGDVGVVLPSASESRTPRVWFLDGEQLRSVAVSRLAHVETCFAMTIHKSQGSEFAHTVVVLPESGGDILTRELVYTGVTRAREFLSVIEPRPNLLGLAIGRQFKRASGLKAKLGS